MTKIILILIPISVLLLVFWTTWGILKQSKKDWGVCEDLEKRSKTVTTKEEIKALHFELVDKGNKINNQYIHARLGIVEGYLCGLYQNAK